MQTTLLGLAIAFILALIAALVGPFFIDWNKFRPQFEAEASKIIGAPVRVGGGLDARLLPTPSLRLRSVVVGGPNDLGKVRADKLDVEFSLGDLMRGEWRANELTINGLALDLGLDREGRIDWPASNGTFDFASLAIDRLNLTGRIALHDGASRATLELSDIAFSGDVRSLAGAIRGGGNFTMDGTRYPFRVSSGQGGDGTGNRVHLSIDPGERPLAADLEGVLSFQSRVPRFEGTATLASPPPKKGSEAVTTPWKIAAKVKANYTAAQLDQIELSYGNEDRALKLVGTGDARFGSSPLLHAALSARQLDADKFMARDDKDAAAPARVLPGLRAALAALPRLPMASQINFGAEQIMLGGRPLQNLSGGLHGDAVLWAIDRLDVRAPGSTRVAFNAARAPVGASGNFSGVLDIDSSDPDVLFAWLQGRSDVAYRNQKPLRLHGDVSVAADRIAIDALKAEINGGAVEGRVALATLPSGGGSRLEAALKADNLDLDAAGGFLRSLQAEWPEEASVSFDIGRALSTGQELKPLTARLAYTPKDIVLDRVRIGSADNVMLEGGGNFDRVHATGKLTLVATSASMVQLAGVMTPLAPQIAARLTAANAGPVRANLALELGTSKAVSGDRVAASAELDLDAPQLKGHVSASASPSASSIRGIDLDALSRSEVGLRSKFSAERGDVLLALLGLDHIVAADGSLQFEGSASGVFRQPLRLSAKMWGANIDAEAQGTAEPSSQKANINLKVRSANLAPLFSLKSSDSAAQNVRLFANLSLAGNKLSFDDLDSVAAGSRLRGHVALNLDEPREIDGELGVDALALAPAVALAIGAAGHEAAEPLGAGLFRGWRGHVGFEALSAALPGGIELRPLGGTLKSDGQSLQLEGLKGKIGGGDVTGSLDARPTANGITLNARLELAGVDGAALHYRGLKMPTGRSSAQMTLMSQGRSLEALTGALSGNGTIKLESAAIAGLDPRALDVAIRASDLNQVPDDTRLRQVVDSALSAAGFPVASAEFPFIIRDGRLRVDATTLETQGARAIVSGGYDLPADQADIRASLASTVIGSATSRPEIQLFAAGPPDTMNRTIDVTALSSWLAVRKIDRETRRLDAIERGEPPPVEPPLPPPATAALPLPAAPEIVPPSLPHVEIPLPGRDPRRLPPKAAIAPPRPAPPHPASQSPAPRPPAAVSQQAAPLPPPIEVRPPGAVPAKPKPKPPMVLTPPAQNP
ncbi:MAG TPA: AsmA-like C-terminal region-containing protein [Bradyrhizobium sp.]